MWARPCTKSLGHLFQVVLKWPNSPIILPNQPSQSTMGRLIWWSTTHFNQRMTIYSRKKALMCKVFPSNLGPITMKWFDGLEDGSIGSYEELTKTFGAKFVTCSRIPRPLDSLLSMAKREGESLKTYLDRY